MTKEIKIANTLGLHARLCSQIAREAGKFESDVYLITKNNKIDAKSVLGLLSLCLPSGSNVVLEASGSDATKAIDDIASIIE